MASARAYHTVSTIASGAAEGSWITINHDWHYMSVGLPTISPSGTLKLQVTNDESAIFDLTDTNDNQLPNWAAGSGGKALDMRDASGVLGGWTKVRPVVSAAQNAARSVTFVFVRRPS